MDNNPKSAAAIMNLIDNISTGPVLDFLEKAGEPQTVNQIIEATGQVQSITSNALAKLRKVKLVNSPGLTGRQRFYTVVPERVKILRQLYSTTVSTFLQ